ncbi:MAG TPA: hypothetical protein DER60_00510 [Syntrophomonas sp.]|nr:hypothetical protein [Syntrophomonas sp.]
MRNMGIITKGDNFEAGILTLHLGTSLTTKGISTWYERDCVKNFDTTDLILVLGGDGTMLRAFQNYGHLQIPFLCINFGTVGFLSSLEPEEIINYWDLIIDGNYKLDERSVLRVSITRKEGYKDLSYYALNDAVIRTTDLHVSRQVLKVDEKELCTCEGDGLIISTSTGSTGYALSAGGAIVDPKIDCIIVNSICPRKTSLRTMLFDLDHNLEVISLDRRPLTVFVDGIESTKINQGDSITIERADIKARFVSLNPDRYFNLLRSKA